MALSEMIRVAVCQVYFTLKGRMTYRVTVTLLSKPTSGVMTAVCEPALLVGGSVYPSGRLLYFVIVLVVLVRLLTT